MVQSVAERLELWCEALNKELTESQEGFDAGGNRAAAAFVAVLADVLRVRTEAFDRFRRQTSAPPHQRLRWLQNIGAGLAQIVSNLGQLDGSIAPRYAPLVASFERVLEKLVPSQLAIFVPVRFFNYELQELHSSAFELHLDGNVDRHQWPVLFLRLPVGLLDSPRHHVLIGHELGHAIAAVEREGQVQHLRKAAQARHSGQPPPPPPPPLLPSPDLSPTQLKDIVDAAWRGSQPLLQAPQGTQMSLNFRAMITAQTAELAKVVTDRWIEELFADAVGACLFGPAFVLAFLETLLPISELERASKDHPPIATRIKAMHDLLSRAELADPLAALPIKLSQRLSSCAAEATDAINRIPAALPPGPDGMLFLTVHELVTSTVPKIHDVAFNRCQGLLYTAVQLKSDLESYLADFFDLGVPPIGVPGQTQLGLATIFNVGQVVAMCHMDEFRLGQDRPAKERRLDQLLLKSVELAEAQRRWEEVG